eukprot:10948327-Ditylum_brightwellii.AAC.1
MTWWAQVSAGTGTPILEETWALPYLEGTWLRRLLEDTQEIQRQVHLYSPWLPTLHRKGDQYMMDAMLNCPLVDTQHLGLINWYRLFLQHVCISDICMSDCKYLAHYLQQDDPPTQPPSCLNI